MRRFMILLSALVCLLVLHAVRAQNAPYLIISDFETQPSRFTPGAIGTLQIELRNQGNRDARDVIVSLQGNEALIPASGTATQTFGGLAPSETRRLTFSLTITDDATSGSLPVEIALRYADRENEVYEQTQTLTLPLAATQAQLILSQVDVVPEPAVAGETVQVRMSIRNVGSAGALQTLVRVAGEGVLLPSIRGDTFPLGDLPPGGVKDISLPLVAAAEEGDGIYIQTLYFDYLEGTTPQQSQTNIAVRLIQSPTPQARLILADYEANPEVAQPGDNVTITLQLRNVGDAAAQEVQISEAETSGGGVMYFTPTEPDTYVDAIVASETPTTLTRTYFTDASAPSGVHDLPLQLRYVGADGESHTEDITLRVFVVVPPKLTLDAEGGLPSQVTQGEPFSLGVTLGNAGEASVSLQRAEISAEGADILNGKSIPLSPLAAEREVPLNARLQATTSGALDITLTIHYLDDLRMARTQTYTLSTWAQPQPTPPPPTPDILEPPTTPEPPPPEDHALGRFLRGFFGLGS